jgi:hypothetical protein
MRTWSIAYPELFSIIDESGTKSFYGCSQEWYAKKWQRMSGCGPTAASNIMLYMNNDMCAAVKKGNCISKDECLSLMEELWEFVTPTLMGVHTTRRFYEGMSEYAESIKMSVRFEACDLPEDKSRRPELAEVLRFIESALEKDCPVAFLNLCNGQEHRLDRWHWVTIISLEHADDDENAVIEVLDEGEIKKLNLSLWYNTTKRGGGFVYFVKQDA